MSNSGKPALGLVVYLVLPNDILGNLRIAVSEAIEGVRKGISWAATRPRGHGLCQKESDERRYIRDHKESLRGNNCRARKKGSDDSSRLRKPASQKGVFKQGDKRRIFTDPNETYTYPDSQQATPPPQTEPRGDHLQGAKVHDTVDPINCVSQFAMLVLTGGKLCSAVR